MTLSSRVMSSQTRNGLFTIAFFITDVITLVVVLTGFMGLALSLVACHAAPPYLPSHPAWEMFPRASSPPSNCPGQYRATVENTNGSFFMGCWGSNSE
jgi:hypothetical protein